MFRSSLTRSPLPRCTRHTVNSQKRKFQTTALRFTQYKYKRFSDGSTWYKDSLNSKRWDSWAKPAVVLPLAVGCGIYFVAHLEQVPESGRWRFMNTSMETEAQVGEMASREIKHEFRDRILPPDHPLSVHVRRVTSRILKHSNLGHVRGETSSLAIDEPLFGSTWTLEDPYAATIRETHGPEKEWDVVVVHDKSIINASASPGLITVYTGILPICRDEQGLAVVLAHEIGHIVARHTAEKLSSQTIKFTLLMVSQFLFGLDFLTGNMLATYLLELPNSRTQEIEADLIGLRLMSRACYDPRAAPEMFERLSKLDDEKITFFATHPSSENRVKKLKEALPAAYSVLVGNPQCGAVRDSLERFREYQSKTMRV